MLSHLIIRTPLLGFTDRSSSDIPSNLYLKAENTQYLGSYKIRGVANVIKKAKETGQDLSQGLIAASAGNMAQAVAVAGSYLKCPVTIYVPSSAPDIKKQAIKSLGAQIAELPFDEIWSMVRSMPDVGSGKLFFHPINTPHLTDGYGSIVQEVFEDLNDADIIAIPFGVGGLALGLSRYIRKVRPDAKIYLCETETAAPFISAKAAGFLVPVVRNPSFIDAIGTPECLADVFVELSHLIDGVEVVPVHKTIVALQSFVNCHDMVCEGAGAVAIAAGIELARRHPDQKVVSIVSGGNISTELVRKLLSEIP